MPAAHTDDDEQDVVHREAAWDPQMDGCRSMLATTVALFADPTFGVTWFSVVPTGPGGKAVDKADPSGEALDNAGPNV